MPSSRPLDKPVSAGDRPTDQPPLVGRRVGHVRIDSLIDRGGMGEVYRGFDEALERRVAVKAIRPDQRPRESARQRFHREARLLSKLQHPNVCGIYDLYQGDAETGDLLILEFVEGRKLGNVLKRGLRFEQKLRIAEEVGAALAAAHELRIIHRDLKPSNVMIQASGRAKVLDFGLARSLDHPGDPLSSPSDVAYREADEDPSPTDPDGEVQTNHQFMVGTLAFMSPEQALGESLTEASDLYSFGLLLQWLFTEVSPYGEDVNRLDLLRRVLQGDTLPARTRDPDLTLLIEDLKRNNPERRPSAVECVDRLRAISGKPVQRRFRRILAAVVVALVFLGGVGFWLNHRRGEEREEAMLAFTHEAKDIEWLMRIAHGLPLQELTLHQAEVRRRMGSLRGLMQTSGVHGRGPGNFALGRGYLVLGEVEKARLHLESAWDADYRRPEVAFAYAGVLAKQYEEARSELPFVEDPAWRRASARRAEEAYRTRVLDYLAVARGRGGGVPVFVEALIAFFEGRLEDAEAGLEQTRERVPWLYEASAWSGEVEVERALIQVAADRLPEAGESFSRAFGHYRKALRVGSSDARLHLSACRVWNLALGSTGLGSTGLGSTGLGSAEELHLGARSACDLALRIDPGLDAARLENSRSSGLMAMAHLAAGRQEEASAMVTEALDWVPDGSNEEVGPQALRFAAWVRLLKARQAERGEGLGAVPDLENELITAVERADRSRRLEPNAPFGLWLQTEALDRWADRRRAHGADPESQWIRIESALREAIRRDPGFATAYLELARLHLRRARDAVSRGDDPGKSLAAGRTAAARAQNLAPELSEAGELLTTLIAFEEGVEESPSKRSGSPRPGVVRPRSNDLPR